MKQAPPSSLLLFSFIQILHFSPIKNRIFLFHASRCTLKQPNHLALEKYFSHSHLLCEHIQHLQDLFTMIFYTFRVYFTLLGCRVFFSLLFRIPLVFLVLALYLWSTVTAICAFVLEMKLYLGNNTLYTIYSHLEHLVFAISITF